MDGIQMYGIQARADAAADAQKTQAAKTSPVKADTERSSIHEMLQEAREKAQERRDSLKLRTNGSQYGDAAMTAYAKLARARSQGEVSAAAGYARRQIARFQAALGSDKDNATRIKGAIRQLKKAVSRAGKKKQELRREDLMKAREKKARLEKERRKAAGLRQELNRRQTMRMVREEGYMREAEIDNRQQEQLAKTELELRTQAQELAAVLTPSLEGAAREYAAAAETAAPSAGAEMDIHA